MLLTEAKNNKNKMARWTAEALISGAEAIKWGYVSRAGARDNSNHVVLNVQVRPAGGQLLHAAGAAWLLPGAAPAVLRPLPLPRHVPSTLADVDT